MSFQINTNINALDALRNLGNTGMMLSQSVQRLSSGLRINSGADDPSGLIASNIYGAQVVGLQAATRNVQNATNFSKTASSGLAEISTLLQSARALAVANGDASLDVNSKQANQAELTNIMASIDRVSNTTQFGTKYLLNGSSGASASVIEGNYASAMNFQGVFNGTTLGASGNINVQITTAATQATVQSVAAAHTTGTDAVGAGTFTVNGKTYSTSASSTFNDVVTMVNADTSTTGVTATFNAATSKINFSQVNYGSSYSVTASASFGLLSGAASGASASGVDAVANVTIGAATVSFAKGNGLNLKDADGNSIMLTASGNAAAGSNSMGYVTVNGSTSFQIGANAGQTANLVLGDFRSAAIGTNALDIVNNPTAAMTAIDSAISAVSVASGRIGSFITDTLSSQQRSLASASENLQAAQSTIRDLDVASEMTNYSKLQILQQSGLAVLSQANSSPNQILNLIRGQ